MPKPKRIFICHSTKDRDFVEREIISLLENHGIDIWYSKDDIQTAAQWKRVIVEGLKSCDWFLVGLSPHSITSPWVEAEVDWAFDHRPDQFVPVIIEECKWDEFNLLLRNLQHVNFSADRQNARIRLLQTWEIEVSTNVASPPPPTSKQTQRPDAAKPKQTEQQESQQADRIEVQCPNGHRQTTKESRRGKRVKCHICSTHFVIPEEGAKTSLPAPVDSVPASDAQKLITNSIGMKLKLIPAGEFLMGSGDIDKMNLDDEKPQHLVKFTKPFYLGIYPVTQEEYQRVLGENPSSNDDHVSQPVECVSWFDAVAFCNRISEQESTQPYYKIDGNTVSVVSGSGYRLPTEAEWEYACRAGTTTKWSFGDDESESGLHAWYDENAWDIGEKYAHRVGQKLPNPWGLYDMHGNVWEWCQDWYAGYGTEKVRSNPKSSAQDESRLLRGGAFDDLAQNARSAYRDFHSPGERIDVIGFRAARTYP